MALTLLATTALLGAASPAIACAVTGARHIAPAMSSSQACALLVGEIARVRGARPGVAATDRLEVTVRIKPPGIASASVMRGSGATRRLLPEISVATAHGMTRGVLIDLARAIARSAQASY